MSLPQINNANPQKIHDFSEKKLCSVQALDTMGKIKEMNGYVRVTLDKLQGIRADLVRNDDNWQDWKFQQLVEALEKWTVRNLIPLSHKRNPEKGNSHSKSYQAKQTKSECVYCGKPDHRSSDRKTAKTVTERRKILSYKKLCFSCTGAKHRAAECRSAKTCLKSKNKHHTSINCTGAKNKAAECRSTKTCLKCKNKHQTSICDKLDESKFEPMLVTTETNVTHPVAIIK